MARASAWHAEGHRFEPDMLHHYFKSRNSSELRDFFCCLFRLVDDVHEIFGLMAVIKGEAHEDGDS